MKHALITLHAQTAIHAGIGSTDNVIDLPIQREAHTAYPCVFGSSMKGALRALATEKNSDYTGILFGNAGNLNTGNAGALLVSDARLLLLPIRSLTGNFRWVSCPQILGRFQQDAKRFQSNIDFQLPKVDTGEVLLSDDTKDHLYLEEYRLYRADTAIDTQLIKELAKMLGYDDAEDRLKKYLAIISDDDFAYLVQYTLPVHAHIAIGDNKIVKDGALWYEETLPSDTVLYFGVAASDSRKKDYPQSANELLDAFCALLPRENPWIQIGGNETVGMGWCEAHILRQEV
ncbi:type III-B CRISPR module RAMP protein Cmr4 [Suttonella ornithocola]|uniref:CRISPR type III-B/RAMP module RAMP protein Cmr4 n=1 Tax=Suttonella ornithocola TaxID=279832 RepID=A0A380MZD1_9GAMM|nr:type III-B CRISPR module RAMP protein Cmr4 [Suttonella ornithocola]SUO97041.1 CRISPR type III-B/RAMP module RAMP protein Cmr4 [Suttonella ornithocola]